LLLCHGRLSDLSDNVLSDTISLDEAYQTARERKDAAGDYIARHDTNMVVVRLWLAQNFCQSD